jgi:parallel beta-helix repeat protein
VSACSYHAAITGNDLGPGTAAEPFRSVQRLADRLAPGQTGCLAPGTYVGAVIVRRSGTASAPVTLRAQIARTATVDGQLRIADGADFVRVEDLVLTGSGGFDRPSPLVNGDDAQFTGNDVTNPGDSCFVLGDKVWGVAERTVIAGNRIHECGLPGTNMDHGVYVRQATDTRIEGNIIERNPDRGVQLFPNADRTLVRGNRITANGEGVIFSGDGIDTSDDNLVTANVITGSLLRWDVESYWWPAAGTGNVLRGNCVSGGKRGAIQPPVGFVAESNVTDPSRCQLTVRDPFVRVG